MADMFRIEGAESLIAELEDRLDVDRIQRNLPKACAIVEASAKRKAPKGKTGALRSSITYKVEGNTGIVYTPLEYAPYIEYGFGIHAEDGNGRKDVPWHYQDEEGNWHSSEGEEPQRFLRPALQENREKILRLLKEGLG